jgi:hypothetical protein
VRPAWIAVLVVTIAFAGACGGGDDEPRRKGEAGGLTIYEVRSQSFSIGVPGHWRTLTADEALPPEARKELVDENPHLAPVMDAVFSEDGPIKLFAFDPAIWKGFATNVNVVAAPLPPETTFDEFAEVTRAEADAYPGRVGAVRVSEVELPGGRAQRLSYRTRIAAAGAEQVVATLQYVLLGKDMGYVVTYSTLPELSERYARPFDRSIRSFRVDG